MGPMENVKKSLSGQILGNSLLPSRLNAVYSVNNARMHDSPQNSIPDEDAEAGDLENPTIPLHDFEDNLRYQLTMPRRKSMQSLYDNSPQKRHQSRRRNHQSNLENRKQSGGSGSGDQSSDEQYPAAFGRKQLSSLYP